MRLLFVTWLVGCTTACGGGDEAAGSGGAGGASGDAAGSPGSPSDAGVDTDARAGTAGASGAGASDAATDATDTDAAAASTATYRNSLSMCWTDASCPRVMAVAHGGLWDVAGAPYDSNAAIAAAYAGDVDGVKIDVRVTSDDVPVISHSSPIQIYESLDCNGKRIEQMTAAEVTACHRFPSQTETFQRLDDVLEYLRGKMVVELTVKLSDDYARTIEEVHALGAEDYAFLEISTSELQDQIPTLPDADTVYYLINVGSTLSEIDTLLDTIKNPRAFLFEFDPTVEVAMLTATRLHPAGVRSFTYTSAAAPTVAELQALFEGGFDVVSSQGAANNVLARKAVNQGRSVSPP